MKDTHNPGSCSYAEPQSQVFIMREGVKVCALGIRQRYRVLTGIEPVTCLSSCDSQWATARASGDNAREVVSEMKPGLQSDLSHVRNSLLTSYGNMQVCKHLHYGDDNLSQKIKAGELNVTM